MVEKASRDVRAYDKDGKLLRFYPATIGSSEKPAPAGTFEVRRVAYNPDYHYNPKFAWKGVKAKEPLTIKRLAGRQIAHCSATLRGSGVKAAAIRRGAVRLFVLIATDGAARGISTPTPLLGSVRGCARADW